MECLQCGNCCPVCPDKVLLDGKVVCKIHPSITGKNRDVWGCQFPPEAYFNCGIACMAVIESLKKKYPNLTYEVETNEDGQILIKKGTLQFND